MILYENTIENFTSAMKKRKLIDFFTDEYFAKTSRKVSPIVRGTWKYTLEVLKQLLDSAGINPDCGIRIDYVMLDTNNRFEVILAGRSNGKTIIYMIEMLAWENVRVTDVQGVVSYYNGELYNKKCAHPSIQSVSYKEYFSNSVNISEIHSCVYLFECSKNAESIKLIENYKSLTNEAPIYFAEEGELLLGKLSVFKTCAGGSSILNEYHERDQLSSKGVDYFLKHITSDKKLSILSEDQRFIIAMVIKKSEDKAPSLIEVDGTSGTGKTMLAISCMIELVNRCKKTIYLTSSILQRDLLEQKLKNKSDLAYDVETMTGFRIKQKASFRNYDVIFVDDAQNLGDTTLKTVLKSGTVIVLLQDDAQIIYRTILSGNELEGMAGTYNKAFSQYNLNRNMRYAGKGSGINWLAHQFQIADTGNYEDWDSDSFPISIVDSPQELMQRIRTNSGDGKTSRVLVRYKQTRDLEYDETSRDRYYLIPEFDFRIPVCTATSRKLSGWFTSDQLIDYAVGPALAQGLEFDHVGVIIGKELGYDKETGQVIINNSYLKEDDDNIRLIKAAYYILFSRGMNGVDLFIQDPSLKEMISERLSYSSRRFAWIKELAAKYQPGFEKSLIDRQKHMSSYSYALSIYETVNEFVARIKQFSEDQLDGNQYKEISDQCSRLLLELQSDPINNDEIRDRYQKIIISTMGKSAWDKLSETGKKCLISSELTYHDMKDYNQLYDFSSVCLQASKAVEYELTNRFYGSYIAYLEALHEKTKDPVLFYDKIPGVLKRQERTRVRLLKEQEVTLGTIPFIVGLNMEGRIADPDAYDSFKGYASNLLLQKDLDVKRTLSKHIKHIIRIKNDYRNKAAHKNPMDVVSAKACLDYIIEVQRALGQMLDDYIE